MLKAGVYRNWDECNTKGFAVLHLVAEKGLMEEWQTLLHLGASPNPQTILGHTPLHLPASSGHVDVVKCLISSGADLRSTTFDGTTPLHAAALNWRSECLALSCEKCWN